MSLPYEEVDSFGRTIIIPSKDRRVNDNTDSRRNRPINATDEYNNNNNNEFYPPSNRPPDWQEGYNNNGPISFQGNELNDQQQYHRQQQQHPPYNRNQDRRLNDNRQIRHNPNFQSRKSNNNLNYPPGPAGNYVHNTDQYPHKRPGGYNNRPRDSRYDDYGHSQQSPPPPPRRDRMHLSKPIHRIGPVMSFKSFMQTQNEDLTPEMFQKLYEKYNLQYLQDFSNAFFLSSITEEWFQDRYNPLKIVQIEEEVCQWSIKESAMIKTSLLEYPVETINAMCLDPSEAKIVNTKKKVINKEKPKTEDENTSEEVVTEKLEVTTVTTNDDVVTNPIIEKKLLGKHLSGHEDRCIVIYGIHANCAKQFFKTFVHETILKANKDNEQDIELPERIIISQPNWSPINADKFERTAWIIMPSSAYLKNVQSILNQIEVNVPGPVTEFDAEDSIPLYSFIIKANIHHVVSLFSKNSNASHYLRVQSDTVKAVELAYLLDIERKIPEETRLNTILENEIVQHALVKPTDRLDLAMAYLRRVHFVSFYAGRRYRDEAHLLTLAPSILYRARPYLPVPTKKPTLPPPPKEVSVHGEVPNNQDVVVVSKNTDAGVEDSNDLPNDTTGKKRKLDETDLEEEEKEKNLEEVDEDNQNSTIDNKDDDNNAIDNKEDDLESGEEVDPNEDDVDVDDKQEEKQSNSTSTVIVTRPPLPLVPKGFKTPNIPLIDTRIELIINDLKSKHDLRLAREQDPSIPLPKDEEDAKAIIQLNEITFEKNIREKCSLENEGKCRCCYSFCSKLFKSADFLGKHLKSKHPDFAFEDFTLNAEPYMRSRYESEDLKSRPLPAVEIESQNRKEFKSVIEILDKYAPPPPLPQTLSNGPKNTPQGFKQQPPYHHHQSHNFDNHRDRRSGGFKNTDRRLSGSSRGSDSSIRGHDERDRRATISGSIPSYQHHHQHQNRHDNKSISTIPPVTNNPVRQISSYIDVDAPKESAVHIDYGVVLLPPTKRRKSLPAK